MGWKVSNKELTLKEKVKLKIDLGDELTSAHISYYAKDTRRNNIESIKKGMHDEDRAKKNAVMGEAVEIAKALLESNPSLPYLVNYLEAFATTNNKAVDGALKQVKALAPETPTIFFSSDPDSGKILCIAHCKTSEAGGLKANDWCGSAVSALINGKGGGKPESTQASGTNTTSLMQVIETAEMFAMDILKVGKVTIAQFGAATPAPAVKAAPAAKAAKAPKAEKKKAATGSAVMIGARSSFSCLYVLVTAAYTGQEIQINPCEGFSFTAGSVSLSEPVSSCLYLATAVGQRQLSGVTALDQASVLQWQLYSGGDLYHSVGGWVVPTQESCEGANQGTVNRSKSDLLGRLAALDQYLVTRTFLVGEMTSLADISMAVTVLSDFPQVLDPAFRSSHRHLTRWYNKSPPALNYLLTLAHYTYFHHKPWLAKAAAKLLSTISTTSDLVCHYSAAISVRDLQSDSKEIRRKISIMNVVFRSMELFSDCEELFSNSVKLFSIFVELLFNCVELLFNCVELLFNCVELLFNCVKLLSNCVNLLYSGVDLLSTCVEKHSIRCNLRDINWMQVRT